MEFVCFFFARERQRGEARVHVASILICTNVYLFTSPEARGDTKRKDKKPKTHLWMVQTEPNDAVEFGFTAASVYSTQSVESVQV